MRYLDLFSGIGAASVALKPLGWTCAALAEIHPASCRVLAQHYPDIPNLGDVTRITDEQIAALGPLDIVIGGSPCQGLSVAGKRKGLEDGRSGLFHEQMRIFHAAHHLCGARFMLWENVPGAFISNAGADFAAVVGAMAGARVAVPADGWRNEGVVLGSAGLVEWSVLDARWFHLAQRRERVYALLDTGDWSSRPPILLEPDAMRGAAGAHRPEESADPGDAAGRAAAGGGRSRPAAAETIGAAEAPWRQPEGGAREPAQADSLSDARIPGLAIAIHAHSIGRGHGSGPEGKIYLDDNTAFTADSSFSSQAVAFIPPDGRSAYEVRRLTPLEHETLQGFPAGYTAVPISTHEKKRVSKNFAETRWRARGDAWDLLLPDTARYAALGNSFAVPVVNWIGRSLERAVSGSRN
ncbi:MAG: DNA cytosine methyltransferase [Burkholderiaceae bacterium]|nr:MAG: DNA cytosine methyltransferase [Burkholderiaceae bacterium]